MAKEILSLELMLTPFPSLALLHRRAWQGARALELVSCHWVPRFSVVARQDASSPQTGPADHLQHRTLSAKSDQIGARSVPLRDVSTAPLLGPEQRVEVP